jgi:signal transduction histidine kinase
MGVFTFNFLKQLNLYNYDNENSNLFLYNDKVRFNQIFNNLLNNANEYTDSGQIKFGYEVHEKSVRFFVSDTGIGIDLSNMDKFFDQFYKIEDNPKKTYSGTGIGLAICKKTVELMGGNIWVESILHNGSTFCFSLPNTPGNE